MTAESSVLIWPILLPLVGGVVAFVVRRGVAGIGLATSLGIGVSVVALGREIQQGHGLRYAVGGWGAPVGIELRADGLSLWMLGLTALVGLGIGLYAAIGFGSGGARAEGTESRHQRDYFWPLWMFLWAALNGLYL